MASNRKSISQPSSGYDEETGAPPKPGIKRKTSRQKREETLQRSRAHSNGSTLGAFYQNDAPAGPPAGPRRRRSSQRGQGLPAQAPGQTQARRLSKPQMAVPPLPPTASATGSDLGDVASLAITGLGDDIDWGEILGGGAPPPSKSSKARNQKSRTGRSPPINNGAQLPTIMDDSEHHEHIRFDKLGELPRNAVARSQTRSSVKSVDSLRVSDVSGNMEEDAVAMLSTLNRDNSMFMSEISDVGFADLINQTEPSNTASNNNRTSLLGSSILESTKASTSSKRSAGSSNTQQQEIASFAAMLHADYGAADTAEPSHPLKGAKGKIPTAGKHSLPYSAASTSDDGTESSEDIFVDEIDEQSPSVLGFLDPTEWLKRDVKYDQNGAPYFDDGSHWTIAGFVRHLLFNPVVPEFTSLQQFSWAVILGILMGFYTAGWKEIIEHSVDIMWKELPEALLEWGFFTELDGAFPLYHWMWICPAFWGGLLSYIFAVLPTPIPGQNEWITNVHTLGVQDSETFGLLFILSTLGMASGLSLGPELPLVLTAGMIGSWLGIQCKQTVLQARVMNITCASAAVGGFFGFPMAGALFVLEIPHRMGLQYFEALSPATIASIVAVLCNRLIVGNDVTGYYSYPFLTTSLPSEIFTSAIIFGLFGALVGVIYAKTVLKLKALVHDFFHAPHDDHVHGHEQDSALDQEKTPLILKEEAGQEKNHKTKTNEPKPLHKKMMQRLHRFACCVIPYEPHRAAAAGVVAGIVSGCIGILFPQVMFWGEAQLQSMIDKGRTPLPVFGRDDEPTAALTAKALCWIDTDDPEAVKQGFGIGCSFLISFAKIVVTGLSLGTGIIGGHFWGPLFTGCTASHFLVDVARFLQDKVGFGGSLATYPCVAILCTMGSTHVVTFRAHTAIMLILTLTISAFDPEDSSKEGGAGVGGAAVAGDYSAVFPLLVVSVFVALHFTRQTVFYAAQRSRVDIMARPEVLCQPGQEGMPVVMNFDDVYEDDGEEYEYESDVTFGNGGYDSDAGTANENTQQQQETVTQEDIEKEFKARVGAMAVAVAPAPPPSKSEVSATSRSGRQNSSEGGPGSRGVSPLPPRPKNSSGEFKSSARGSSEIPELGAMSSSRLDELLAKPLDNPKPTRARHRRIQSAPNVDFTSKKSMKDRAGSTGGDSAAGGPPTRHARSDSFGSQASGRVMQVATIGNLSLEQPSLMEQARMLAASRHVRHPSMPRLGNRRGHSRHNSASSIGGNSNGPPLQVSLGGGRNNGVSSSEVERAFTSAVNQQRVGNRTADGSTRGVSPS